MTDDDAPRGFGLLARRALLRGVVLAALLAGLFPLVGTGLLVAGIRFEPWRLLLWAIAGVVFGLAATPALAGELVAGRFAPSLRRDSLAGLGAGLAGTAACVAALLQMVFTVEAVANGVEAAWRELARGVSSVLGDELGVTIGIFAPIAVPFAAATIARLREARLSLAVVASAVPTLAVVGVIALVDLYRGHVRDGLYGAQIGVATAFALGLPLAARGGERLERRLREWLEGERP